MQRCTAEVATGLQMRYWVYLYFFWDGQNTDRHWSLLYFAKTSSSRRDEDQGVQKASLSRYGTQMPMIMLCKKIFLFFYFFLILPEDISQVYSTRNVLVKICPDS